jgi:hypothetical protein
MSPPHSFARRYGPSASGTAAGFDATLPSTYMPGTPDAQDLGQDPNRWNSDMYGDGECVTNAVGNASISTCSSCSIIPLQTVKCAA